MVTLPFRPWRKIVADHRVDTKHIPPKDKESIMNYFSCFNKTAQEGYKFQNYFETLARFGLT
jgi:hypothetical protein